MAARVGHLKAHVRRVMDRRVLGEGILRERILCKRILTERVLRERVLAERVLRERILRKRGLGRDGKGKRPRRVRLGDDRDPWSTTGTCVSVDVACANPAVKSVTDVLAPLAMSAPLALISAIVIRMDVATFGPTMTLPVTVENGPMAMSAWRLC